MSWKLSRTVLRGADGGNAARLLDKRVDEKTKQPYAISLRDGALFAFAGLWERWKDKATGQALETYTIVTTDPNALMEPIHNRMPVILHRQDFDRWLTPGDASQLPVDLLRPFPVEEMKAWTVSSRVGNVKNNDPTLVEPVDPKPSSSLLPLDE